MELLCLTVGRKGFRCGQTQACLTTTMQMLAVTLARSHARTHVTGRASEQGSVRPKTLALFVQPLPLSYYRLSTVFARIICISRTVDLFNQSLWHFRGGPVAALRQ